MQPDGKPAAGAKVLGKYADRDGKLTLSGLFPYRNHELMATLPEQGLAARFTVSPRGEKQPVAVDVTLQSVGKVQGRVVDENGRPVSNATVQLLQHVPDAETKIVFYSTAGAIPINVAPDGTFVMEDLVPGMPYNVSVTAPGHASAFGAPFDGKSGSTISLSDIVLPRADQVVAGTVVDPRGRPVAGVQVHGTPVRAGGIERSVRISSGQVFTDTNGRFRLTGIPRGPVRLSAYVSPTGTQEDRLVRTHSALMVEAGVKDARIVLAGPDVQSPVEAVVGKPAPEFTVKQWINSTNDKADKTFRATSFPGRVVVLAFLDEATPSTKWMKQLDEVRKNVTEHRLEIVRVYELPISMREVTALSPTTAALVEPGLVPGGYSEAFQKYGVRATPAVFLIDPNGILRFADPEPGELQARIAELTKAK
jgi:hypothetical protein